MSWISTRFDEAIRFRYVAGARGQRTGRFVTPWMPPSEVCVIVAPLLGGCVVDRGYRRIAMGPGRVIIIPPGMRHRARDDGSPELVQDWVRIRCTVFATIDLFSLLSPPPTLDGEDAAEVGRLIAELNAAAAHAQRLDLRAIAAREACGMNLIRMILDRSEITPRLDERLVALQRVQPVLALIEERLEERLDRRALARAAGLSGSRLQAVFTAATGLSPYAFLARQRLRRAQDLLLGSDLSVQAVAEAVGYRDPFHFSRSFKQAFGSSPREYRIRVRDGW
jgi:AraC-like DNA-binding protein